MSVNDIEWIKGILKEIKADMGTVIETTVDNTVRIAAIEITCASRRKTRESFREFALLVTAIASCAAAYGVFQ